MGGTIVQSVLLMMAIASFGWATWLLRKPQNDQTQELLVEATLSLVAWLEAHQPAAAESDHKTEILTLAKHAEMDSVSIAKALNLDLAEVRFVMEVAAWQK